MDNGVIFQYKPKEEDNPLIRNICKQLGNCIIEGAKVHENCLLILTSYKNVYVLKNITEGEPQLLCATEYGKQK